MHRGLKIALIVIIVIFAAVLAVSWYPQYFKNRQAAQTSTENDEYSRVSKLILEQNYEQAIKAAQSFLALHPKSAEIWHLKGAAEYSAGLFADAKISFENVLTIDPKHEASRNYLRQLDISPNEVVVTAREAFISQEDFESRMQVDFAGILNFEKAVKKTSNIPEYLTATYVSGANFANTVSALHDRLKDDGYNISELAEATVFSEGNSSEIKIIVVEKTSRQVIVNYQKLN